jgi:hypothetical protein
VDDPEPHGETGVFDGLEALGPAEILLKVLMKRLQRPFYCGV